MPVLPWQLIAFGWGFNDAAHFSRAFRERFRRSPREWRQLKGGDGGALQQGSIKAR